MENEDANQRNSVNIEFEGGAGKCGGGKERARIWEEKGKIRFSGVAICPNPCYTLSISYSITDDYVELNVEKQPSSQICIQCIARMPFEGKMYDISLTGKEVSLKIEGKEIAHKTF